MSRPVERWLETFMCKQYADIFENYGFKTLQSVCQLDMVQLQNMGVLPEHCGKIMENVSVLRQTTLHGTSSATSGPCLDFNVDSAMTNSASSVLQNISRSHARGSFEGESMVRPSLDPRGAGMMPRARMPRPGHPHPYNYVEYTQMRGMEQMCHQEQAGYQSGHMQMYQQHPLQHCPPMHPENPYVLPPATPPGAMGSGMMVGYRGRPPLNYAPRQYPVQWNIPMERRPGAMHPTTQEELPMSALPQGSPGSQAPRPSSNQMPCSPQEVADSILQMATSAYPCNGPQVIPPGESVNKYNPSAGPLPPNQLPPNQVTPNQRPPIKVSPTQMMSCNPDLIPPNQVSPNQIPSNQVSQSITSGSETADNLPGCKQSSSDPNSQATISCTGTSLSTSNVSVSSLQEQTPESELNMPSPIPSISLAQDSVSILPMPASISDKKDNQSMKLLSDSQMCAHNSDIDSPVLSPPQVSHSNPALALGKSTASAQYSYPCASPVSSVSPSSPRLQTAHSPGSIHSNSSLTTMDSEKSLSQAASSVSSLNQPYTCIPPALSLGHSQMGHVQQHIASLSHSSQGQQNITQDKSISESQNQSSINYRVPQISPNVSQGLYMPAGYQGIAVPENVNATAQFSPFTATRGDERYGDSQQITNMCVPYDYQHMPYNVHPQNQNMPLASQMMRRNSPQFSMPGPMYGPNAIQGYQDLSHQSMLAGVSCMSQQIGHQGMGKSQGMNSYSRGMPGPTLEPHSNSSQSVLSSHDVGGPSQYSVSGENNSKATLSANPLQSLQRLVMLPESQVVDPKSVVNEANSSGEPGQKNEEETDGLVRMAETISNPTFACIDGEHCGSDIDESMNKCPHEEQESPPHQLLTLDGPSPVTPDHGNIVKCENKTSPNMTMECENETSSKPKNNQVKERNLPSNSDCDLSSEKSHDNNALIGNNVIGNNDLANANKPQESLPKRRGRKRKVKFKNTETKIMSNEDIVRKKALTFSPECAKETNSHTTDVDIKCVDEQKKLQKIVKESKMECPKDGNTKDEGSNNELPMSKINPGKYVVPKLCGKSESHVENNDNINATLPKVALQQCTQTRGREACSSDVNNEKYAEKSDVSVENASDDSIHDKHAHPPQLSLEANTCYTEEQSCPPNLTVQTPTNTCIDQLPDKTNETICDSTKCQVNFGEHENKVHDHKACKLTSESKRGSVLNKELLCEDTPKNAHKNLLISNTPFPKNSELNACMCSNHTDQVSSDNINNTFVDSTVQSEKADVCNDRQCKYDSETIQIKINYIFDGKKDESFSRSNLEILEESTPAEMEDEKKQSSDILTQNMKVIEELHSEPKGSVPVMDSKAQTDFAGKNDIKRAIYSVKNVDICDNSHLLSGNIENFDVDNVSTKPDELSVKEKLKGTSPTNVLVFKETISRETLKQSNTTKLAKVESENTEIKNLAKYAKAEYIHRKPKERTMSGKSYHSQDENLSQPCEIVVSDSKSVMENKSENTTSTPVPSEVKITFEENSSGSDPTKTKYHFDEKENVSSVVSQSKLCPMSVVAMIPNRQSGRRKKTLNQIIAAISACHTVDGVTTGERKNSFDEMDILERSAKSLLSESVSASVDSSGDIIPSPPHESSSSGKDGPFTRELLTQDSSPDQVDSGLSDSLDDSQIENTTPRSQRRQRKRNQIGMPIYADTHSEEDESELLRMNTQHKRKKKKVPTATLR